MTRRAREDRGNTLRHAAHYPLPVRLGAVLIACGAFLGAPLGLAAAKCKIAKVVDVPITMNSLRPTINVKINGRDARFVLDSGAFYSMMSSATAAEYNLKTTPGPFGLRMMGVGGVADVRVATVKELSIFGITLKNHDFLVGGSEIGNAGLLGQEFLELFDVEYDLASGAIRLFRTEDCDRTVLAYWLAAGQDFSAMKIDRTDFMHPHTIGAAFVNDKPIRVTFDTGAFTSVLSLKAAERAGVKPDSPGVVASGYASGIGRGMTKEYIAPFASFKIGDSEEIKNTRLRIADIGLDNSDMLLGADFFVSHRIFVANKEHRLYLTYNGGPVFNLSRKPAAASEGSAEEPSDARTGEAPPAENSQGAAARAAELSRLGSALAARRDFGPALADLSKAIELSPNEAEFYYQRADAYRASGQVDLALADYDHVLMLKPDYLPAYIPRAEIKLAKQDKPGAIADLEAVDRLAPKQADLRYGLAEFYVRMDRLASAIEQFSQWIQSHPDDSRMLGARAQRCMSSALLNQDLPTALSDCNAAVRGADKTNENHSYLFVYRGLVRLRRGDYDKAIADFNDALKLMPKNARALYARAVAESRENKPKESASDGDAARHIAPHVAEYFERYGIVP
jgi:tetratricopeptide (TPR) repeat protein/predicted aspartyl protease